MFEEEVIKNAYTKTKFQDKKIFNDMYELLKEENSEYIKERKELLAEVESVFKIKLLTYHIERANKTFASIFPFLLTPNRDRI